MVSNEWPHEAPRKDGTQKRRNIHNVWTNHACSHICQTEVEIQAVFVHCTKKYKEKKKKKNRESCRRKDQRGGEANGVFKS